MHFCYKPEVLLNARIRLDVSLKHLHLFSQRYNLLQSRAFELRYCDQLCISTVYTCIKSHLHFLNAVIRVQIQQTAVHRQGQEVDTRTCCSEEHGKSL